MYAKPNTCLPISKFFEKLQVKPWLAAGIDITNCGYINGQCDSYWLQDKSFYGFDRNTVAQTIYDAERAIEQVVGYPLCAREFCERVPYPKDGCGMKRRDGLYKSIETKYKPAVIGRRRTTLLGNVELSYMDADGDGFRETAIGTMSASSLPVGLGAYYPNRDGAEDFRIRPVSIKFDGTQIVVKLAVWDAIEPDAYAETALAGMVVNGCCTFDSNGVPISPCPLLSSLDLYIIDADTTDAVKLIYSDKPLTCTCSQSEPCQTETLPACGQITSIPKFVRVFPLSDAGCCQCCEHQQPDFVEITYIAGGCDSCNWRSGCYCEAFEQAIFALAAAWLPYRACGCSCEIGRLLDLQTVYDINRLPFAISNSPLLMLFFAFGRSGELQAANIVHRIIANG